MAYDIRWVMEYADKTRRFGEWSKPADRPEFKACNQPRGGFIRAVIETKDCLGNINRLAECLREDFLEFRWVCGARGVKGKLKGHICGLMLVSHTEKLTAYINGEVKVEPNTETRPTSLSWDNI